MPYDWIQIKVDPKLKELAGLRADELDIPLSELVVQALAEKLGRTDLAKIPRGRSGRPRNKLVGNHG